MHFTQKNESRREEDLQKHDMLMGGGGDTSCETISTVRHLFYTASILAGVLDYV